MKEFFGYHITASRSQLQADAERLVRRNITPEAWDRLNRFERLAVEAAAMSAAAYNDREPLTDVTRAIYTRVRKDEKEVRVA